MAPHCAHTSCTARAPESFQVLNHWSCEGGIRCDVYSTHLKSVGFQRLYTLEGGVQRYLAQQGPEGWQGSLFVFDSRMAIEPGVVRLGPWLQRHTRCRRVACSSS